MYNIVLMDISVQSYLPTLTVKLLHISIVFDHGRNVLSQDVHVNRTLHFSFGILPKFRRKQEKSLSTLQPIVDQLMNDA